MASKWHQWVQQLPPSVPLTESVKSHSLLLSALVLVAMHLAEPLWLQAIVHCTCSGAGQSILPSTSSIGRHSSFYFQPSPLPCSMLALHHAKNLWPSCPRLQSFSPEPILRPLRCCCHHPFERASAGPLTEHSRPLSWIRILSGWSDLRSPPPFTQSSREPNTNNTFKLGYPSLI